MASETDQIVHRFLEHIRGFEPVIAQYGDLGLVAAVGAEGFGIPAPGQTFLIAAALLAAKGTMSASTVFTLAWTASVLGNLIGYAIGRFAGHRLIAWLGANVSHMARIEHFFSRWGAWLVVLSRFAEGFRQLTSIVAGSMEMPWWRFLMATMIGAALWVGIIGVGVYFLDEHFYQVAGWMHSKRHIAWIVAGLSGVALLAYGLFGREPTKPDIEEQ